MVSNDIHKIPFYSLPFGSHVRGNKFYIRNIPLLSLIEKYGTPLFIYDGNTIIQNVNNIRKNLPEFDIFYSIKANPSLGICKLLKLEGIGVEIASGGELLTALEVGFTGENITYAGPAKKDTELSMAIENNICSINIESFNELIRLENIAKELGKTINASVRVNINRGRIESPEIMAGGPSRFGIDEESVFSHNKLNGFKNINLIGFHVYTASQILDPKEIAENLIKTTSFAHSWIKERGELKLVSFGGGFGVPYNLTDIPLDLEMLSKEWSSSLIDLLSLADSRLILELGRYIVANSGMFFTTVIDVKQSRGEIFIATDGGINNFIRPKFMKINHPVFTLTKIAQKETDIVDIGGPLCTPLDIIANNIKTPALEIGDVICFTNAGAYGYSLSMLDFLSHPTPAEILIFDDDAYFLRKRGKFDMYIKEQIIPDLFSISRSNDAAIK